MKRSNAPCRSFTRWNNPPRREEAAWQWRFPTLSPGYFPRTEGHAVDFIITHCAPTSIQQKLGVLGYEPDALTDFLDEVARTCTFRHWFFGRYHQNRVIDRRFVVLYEQIIPLLR